MVEYALIAGFIAGAAGATLPGVAGSTSTILSKVQSVLSGAAGRGAATTTAPTSP